MTGIHTATAELYRLFDALNRKEWNGELPTPQITIQKADSRAVLGWTTVQKVWKGREERYEINIVAENLSRPVVEIASTLLHEMVHMANLNNGILDCTGHQYHNKHFKTEAERVGLVVEQVQQYGFAQTYPGQALLEWFGAEPLNPQAFSFYREGRGSFGGGQGGRGGNGGQGGRPGRGSKTKMKKWSCGCTNVRCAVELHATCEKCGEPFTRQDPV